MSRDNSDRELTRVDTLLGTQLNRRSILKRGLALGLSAPVISALLAACADDDADTSADDEASTDDSDAATEDEVETPEEDEEEAADEPVDAEDEDAADDEEAEAEAEPSAGGSVRAVMPQLASDPTTMNPVFTRGGHEQAITTLHFGGLLQMNGNLNPVPELAENWEMAADATSLVFNIHPDAEWSDGEPVTADDVIFTFETILTADLASPRTAQPMQILGGREFFDGEADTIEGLNAPDEKTIEIELAEPNAIWALQLHSLTGQGIIPKHVYEEIEPVSLEGHELSRMPVVGAGAFQLSRWETEQFLEFTANENYVYGAPNIERIELMLMAPDVGLAQLETGEMDIVNVPFNELDRTERMAGVQVLTNPSVSITQLMVNNSREYLTVPVKQAMMYAIDHEGIVNAGYAGLATPAYTTVIGPEEWLGTIEEIQEAADLTIYEYDPERAMQILEEEGWDPNQTVELIYVTDMLDELAAWTIIQDNLRAVGIDLELRQVEFATMREMRTNGEFDLIVLRGGIPAVDPGTRITGFIPQPDGTENEIRWHNERVIELEAAGLATADLDERREIYLEIAKILNEELPHLWLWSPQIVFGVSERLSGFEVPGHFSNIVWNAHEWSVSS